MVSSANRVPATVNKWEQIENLAWANSWWSVPTRRQRSISHTNHTDRKQLRQIGHRISSCRYPKRSMEKSEQRMQLAANGQQMAMPVHSTSDWPKKMPSSIASQYTLVCIWNGRRQVALLKNPWVDSQSHSSHNVSNSVYLLPECFDNGRQSTPQVGTFTHWLKSEWKIANHRPLRMKSKQLQHAKANCKYWSKLN